MQSWDYHLEIIVVFQDVSCSTDKDGDSEGSDDSYEGPKKGQKYNSSFVGQNTGEDYVAIERQSGFLDLLTLCQHCVFAKVGEIILAKRYLQTMLLWL